ncbi:MAG: hypothetical protein IPH94_09390 [Saprospiraceae bacterium]|nr:hypothetical protein [Saprospiraceae bacterium]MBK7221523.1 hypothetical protein [Saprospiraceae bacterium]MBK7788395.1 hypothetical protein [Saprospiraceae bacterium]MBK8110967.1 hypothetical protein [Saprospiraceae bacterium]MBK8851611.1 hypothetical protein [Saprospiraceae bacterium]
MSEEVMHSKRKEKRWVLFIVALLALNPPFIFLFNVPDFIAGIPVFYFYCIAMWILLIIFTRLVSKKPGQ